MKATTNKEIENVNTLNDYLNVLQKNFNCEACKIGLLVRHTLINTILNKLSATNIILAQNVRVKVTQAATVHQFIEIVKANFNTQEQFTQAAKKNLVSDTETLLLLTRLKEKDETPETGTTTTDEKKKKERPRHLK